MTNPFAEQALSVTQFVNLIDESLVAFDGVTVEGEVTEFRIIHNKWVTFQLKDEKSNVGCFMTMWNYKTEIEDGMTVRAVGRPRLRDKGFFSFVLESVQPTGEGALKKAFELLKKKLTEEGLFADDRKRTLPVFPQHVALITSRDAAAYADFLKVLQARQGGLNISFIHTQVQGDDAPRQIAQTLEDANTKLTDLDAIVMVRGGGSIEDLVAFNDENVVRTVAASRTPIIVGVGHERDVTLAELAADVRASTPSNAAELLVRTREEVSAEVSQLRSQLAYQVQDQITKYRTTNNRLLDILRGQIGQLNLEIKQLRDRLSRSVHDQLAKYRTTSVRLVDILRAQVNQMKQGLQQLFRMLQTLSPGQTLKRGYSITRTSGGKALKNVADVKAGETITTQLTDGRFDSIVN